jgi:hypothetical protein
LARPFSFLFAFPASLHLVGMFPLLLLFFAFVSSCVGQPLVSTYEWINGVNTSNTSPSTTPASRAATNMVPHPLNPNQSVLFGGFGWLGGTSGRISNTWTWDGSLPNDRQWTVSNLKALVGLTPL